MKNVLITGASRRISRATAVLAGTHSRSVGVNYAANTRAAGAVRLGGSKAAILKGDMSVEADVVPYSQGQRTSLAGSTAW